MQTHKNSSYNFFIVSFFAWFFGMIKWKKKWGRKKKSRRVITQSPVDVLIAGNLSKAMSFLLSFISVILQLTQIFFKSLANWPFMEAGELILKNYSKGSWTKNPFFNSFEWSSFYKISQKKNCFFSKLFYHFNQSSFFTC